MRIRVTNIGSHCWCDKRCLDPCPTSWMSHIIDCLREQWDCAIPGDVLEFGGPCAGTQKGGCAITSSVSLKATPLGPLRDDKFPDDISRMWWLRSAGINEWRQFCNWWRWSLTTCRFTRSPYTRMGRNSQMWLCFRTFRLHTSAVYYKLDLQIENKWQVCSIIANPLDRFSEAVVIVL